jgi:HlyD family secretion protein
VLDRTDREVAAVDIARPDFVRKRKIRLAICGAAALIALPTLTIGVSRLAPAAPVVERSTVWFDSVHRGEMLREVRGLGTLVPVDIRWIPAQTSARVNKIVLQSGAIVKPDSVILELSDQQLQHDALEAEYGYKAAEADLANLRVQLASNVMTQQSAAADVESQYQQAKLQAEVDNQLAVEGLQAAMISKKSAVAAEQLAIKQALAQEQLKIADDAAKAQVGAQRAHLEQQRVLFELKKSQLDALHVRAGLNGVLSAVSVEVGQQVTPGTNLVRVADPKHLKATVQVPETQAKDIQIGQRASVDTHNGIVEGHVTRIDAGVVNGAVPVDVSFDGPQPAGARPDLSVEGTIEIERIPNILYVGRPVQGAENSAIGLFKLVDGGRAAVRVTVQLGRSSVNSVEIVRGLQLGDQVILSDMSGWDAHDRVRLN